MATDARQEILARISGALGPRADKAAIEAEWRALPRLYRRESVQARADVLDRFVERLRDYDAQVLRTDAAGVSGAIQQMLAARGVKRVLVPAGFPKTLMSPGTSFRRDDSLSYAEVDGCDGVLTECAIAIAETGTIVLQNSGGLERRAVSLIPDYHLCVVQATRVLATVPEAIAALQPTASLPTTFISGPSATADIEMTRIKGVHGPRFLDVLLVAE